MNISVFFFLFFLFFFFCRGELLFESDGDV